jgi:hypothetical protein
VLSNQQRHQWEALQKKNLRDLEQKEKVTERDFQKSHNLAMMNEEKKYHILLETHELHSSALNQKDCEDSKRVDASRSEPVQSVGGAKLGMSGPRCQ